jgi:hypothetical protein
MVSRSVGSGHGFTRALYGGALLLLALGLGGWAAARLQEDVAVAPAEQAASYMEQGGELAPDRLRPLAAAADLATGCRTGIRRAAVTLHLSGLDVSDGPSAAAAFAPSIRAITAALHCSPLDGNLWLRLAGVEAAADAPLGQVVQALRMSYWTAPNEGWVMLPRIVFAAPLQAAGVPLLAAEFGDDLRNTVLYGASEDVVALRAMLPDALQPKVDRLVAALPETHRSALDDAFARAGGMSAADLYRRRWGNPNLAIFRPDARDGNAAPQNSK